MTDKKNASSSQENEEAASPVLDRHREKVQITLAQKLIHELYKSNFIDFVERLTGAGH